MSRPLLTTQQIREKHSTAEIQDEAQHAYDQNIDKMMGFIKSKNLDSNSMIVRSLGNCIYFLTLNADKRVDVEQRLRKVITERNKKWIKRLTYLLGDPELCEYLIFKQEDIKKYIGWLNDEIDWWSKKTISGRNQALIYNLGPAIMDLKYDLEYRHTDIIQFIYNLFVEFNFDFYSGEFYSMENHDTVRKVYVDPIINDFQPQMHGIDPNRIQALKRGESGREALQRVREMDRSRRVPVTIKIKHKKFGT